jgi:hypothetical protein
LVLPLVAFAFCALLLPEMLGSALTRMAMPWGSRERSGALAVEVETTPAGHGPTKAAEPPASPTTRPAAGESLRAEAARLRDEAEAWSKQPAAKDGDRLATALDEHASAAESRTSLTDASEAADWLTTHADAAGSLADAIRQLARASTDRTARAEFDAALESFAESVQRRPGSPPEGRSAGQGQVGRVRAASGSGEGHGGSASANSLNQGTRTERVEATASRHGLGNLEGVPAAYRAAAEAYFKRLAEDAR